MASRLTIGVVSDTHGLVRPEVLRSLEGADVILHAGDVGGAHVLEELGRLAPVIAVRGNVDTDAWGRLLPERRLLDPGGVPLLLLHDRASVGVVSAGEGPRVIVFGHSHQPLSTRRRGVLWFNPGSCGPRRFSLPASIGRLVIEDGRVRPRLVPLDRPLRS